MSVGIEALYGLRVSWFQVEQDSYGDFMAMASGCFSNNIGLFVRVSLKP